MTETDVKVIGGVIAKAIKTATAALTGAIDAVRSSLEAVTTKHEAQLASLNIAADAAEAGRNADQLAFREYGTRLDAMETGIVRPSIEACEARLSALEKAAPPDLTPIEASVSTLEQDALALRVRMDALEHRELSTEAITKAADEALRKEFASVAAPARTVKRVVRDAHGRIDHVVEEAIA